jgi:hypothetical protein
MSSPTCSPREFREILSVPGLKGSSLCALVGSRQGELARFEFDEDAVADQAFELGAHARGVLGLQSGAQHSADVLGAQPVRGPGLGQVRLHDLRHTCVSLLLDMGIPPHIIREIVGHPDIEITMTIYAHASLDEKRKALGKLGDALA